MKTVAKNSRALFDYSIGQTFVAGMALEGREVKSVKLGHISMTGSFIVSDMQSASLLNCHIGPYKYAPTKDYDPTRSRKLLLTKAELQQLAHKEKGTTLVPLEIAVGQRGLVKLVFGIGKGRKKADKREYLQKRDTQRDIRRSVDR
jgi:SsrA-binding protein